MYSHGFNQPNFGGSLLIIHSGVILCVRNYPQVHLQHVILYKVEDYVEIINAVHTIASFIPIQCRQIAPNGLLPALMTESGKAFSSTWAIPTCLGHCMNNVAYIKVRSCRKLAITSTTVETFFSGYMSECYAIQDSPLDSLGTGGCVNMFLV